MENPTLPADFDLFAQNFTILLPDGTQMNRTMQELNQYRMYGFHLAINYGAGVGASVMLLLILLLLTRAEKRKSFIFFLNALCLLTNTIRCVLLGCFLTSEFYHPYAVLSGDLERIKGPTLATHVTTNIFTLVVTALVLVSLSLQVWIVCVTTPALQRNIIMGVTTGMACVAFAYKFIVCYYSIKTVLAYEEMTPYLDLFSKSYVTQAVSIWLFSCVFTYKLGYAIVQRRRLNMPQFGPMQIVFIMGCQTMFAPALFSTLQFANTSPEIINNVLTVVCLFLPLSAIWAGVVNDSDVAGAGKDSHHRLFRGEFYRSSVSTNLSGSSTAYAKSRLMSVSTYGKGKDIESATTTPTSLVHKTSMDGNGIRVDRDFGFSRIDAAGRV
ncbi:pheromone receptor [Decorospora gaudefroyi]|uniref:Pheromone receptor n=1 Tax=Decorospora gaudefroyi TaxID=184978 RepID=A0A6A5KAT8_9PLEO|nr:pheromone receptor [Decorospora gaudefroyi]